MGVYIVGLYVGLQEFKSRENGSISYAVMIATGADAYRVFMAPTFSASEVADLTIGETVRVKCRPYVNKNGNLGFSGGTEVLVMS